jgi:hypothetical protein
MRRVERSRSYTCDRLVPDGKGELLSRATLRSAGVERRSRAPLTSTPTQAHSEEECYSGASALAPSGLPPPSGRNGEVRRHPRRARRTGFEAGCAAGGGATGSVALAVQEQSSTPVK